MRQFWNTYQEHPVFWFWYFSAFAMLALVGALGSLVRWKPPFTVVNVILLGFWAYGTWRISRDFHKRQRRRMRLRSNQS